MKTVLVQYRVHAEQVGAHEALIADVFADLRSTAPAGFAYEVFKLEDGCSFVHLARIASPGNPLPALPAFQRFQAGLPERCATPSAAEELDLVAAFNEG